MRCLVMPDAAHRCPMGARLRLGQATSTDLPSRSVFLMRGPLLAAVRRSIREQGSELSSRQVDELLDERLSHRREHI